MALILLAGDTNHPLGGITYDSEVTLHLWQFRSDDSDEPLHFYPVLRGEDWDGTNDMDLGIPYRAIEDEADIRLARVEEARNRLEWLVRSLQGLSAAPWRLEISVCRTDVGTDLQTLTDVLRGKARASDFSIEQLTRVDHIVFRVQPLESPSAEDEE